MMNQMHALVFTRSDCSSRKTGMQKLPWHEGVCVEDLHGGQNESQVE